MNPGKSMLLWWLYNWLYKPGDVREERGSINNYSEITGISRLCPGQTRMCSHLLVSSRSEPTAVGPFLGLHLAHQPLLQDGHEPREGGAPKRKLSSLYISKCRRLSLYCLLLRWTLFLRIILIINYWKDQFSSGMHVPVWHLVIRSPTPLWSSKRKTIQAHR